MKLEYEPRQLALEFVVLTNMVYSMYYGFVATCRGLASERTEKPPEENLRGYFLYVGIWQDFLSMDQTTKP